jgi:hypothetical protein
MIKAQIQIILFVMPSLEYQLRGRDGIASCRIKSLGPVCSEKCGTITLITSEDEGEGREEKLIQLIFLQVLSKISSRKHKSVNVRPSRRLHLL